MRKFLKYIVVYSIATVIAVSCTADFSRIIDWPLNNPLQVIKDAGIRHLTKNAGNIANLPLKQQAVIENVPFLQQLPELRRGCEVTSLAMLLQYGGVQVDKMELAKEISYVPFQQDGKHGNPNEGFVGHMYTLAQPGYGVYHKPIYELAQRYLPGNVVDLTGQDILQVYKLISSGSPVWVITNATFQVLPESEFEIWETNEGTIQITYQEHSVVIVGYDEENVYVNDPLGSKPQTAYPRKQFERAWEQMGKQAISILPG